MGTKVQSAKQVDRRVQGWQGSQKKLDNAPSRWPRWAAMNVGAAPTFMVWSLLAPTSTKWCTSRSRWRLQHAATNNGVAPCCTLVCALIFVSANLHQVPHDIKIVRTKRTNAKAPSCQVLCFVHVFLRHASSIVAGCCRLPTWYPLSPLQSAKVLCLILRAFHPIQGCTPVSLRSLKSKHS